MSFVFTRERISRAEMLPLVKAAQQNVEMRNVLLVKLLPPFWKWAAKFASDELACYDLVVEGVLYFPGMLASFDAARSPAFIPWMVMCLRQRFAKCLANRVIMNDVELQEDAPEVAMECNFSARIELEEQEEQKLKIQVGVKLLTSREREIIYHRYIAGRTLRETGEIFGFSREYARLQEASALRKIREACNVQA